MKQCGAPFIFTPFQPLKVSHTIIFQVLSVSPWGFWVWGPLGRDLGYWGVESRQVGCGLERWGSSHQSTPTQMFWVIRWHLQVTTWRHQTPRYSNCHKSDVSYKEILSRAPSVWVTLHKADWILQFHTQNACNTFFLTKSWWVCWARSHSKE